MTADLPPHFNETLDDLGFDIETGDVMVLDEVKFSATPEGKARAALNIAKAARKARKGERRSRGAAAVVKKKPPARKK